MKVGDLVRLRFEIRVDDLMGLVTAVHQEFNEYGFVSAPDEFALTVLLPKNPFSGAMGSMDLEVFSSEVVEVIHESR